MRRTVMALAAVGLLFASACGQDDSDTATDGDSARPAAAGAAARRATETTETTETTEAGSDTGDVATDGGDASNIEIVGERDAPACEEGDYPGQGLRQRPADAPGPVETTTPATPTTVCEPVLGTGDVQITLRWNSSADLDLHVTEPDGTEIWFGNRGPTATGGQLDVDSNVGCEQEASVENVFWPSEVAPEGDYTIEIVGYSVDGCGSGDYEVTALVRGEEVLQETGTVGEDESQEYSIEA